MDDLAQLRWGVYNTRVRPVDSTDSAHPRGGRCPWCWSGLSLADGVGLAQNITVEARVKACFFFHPRTDHTIYKNVFVLSRTYQKSVLTGWYCQRKNDENANDDVFQMRMQSKLEIRQSPEILNQFSLYVNINLVLTKYTYNYNCNVRHLWKQEMHGKAWLF